MRVFIVLLLGTRAPQPHLARPAMGPGLDPGGTRLGPLRVVRDMSKANVAGPHRSPCRSKNRGRDLKASRASTRAPQVTAPSGVLLIRPNKIRDAPATFQWE